MDQIDYNDKQVLLISEPVRPMESSSWRAAE